MKDHYPTVGKVNLNASYLKQRETTRSNLNKLHLLLRNIVQVVGIDLTTNMVLENPYLIGVYEILVEMFEKKDEEGTLIVNPQPISELIFI